MNVPSAELLASYRAGDASAADEIFRRYVGRLTVLARSRMAPRLARRVDPDDVVQSAYRSFFVRARDGSLALTRSGDLWRLLVKITLRKVCRQAARHGAEKRDMERELATASLDELADLEQHVARSPSPAEVVAAAEELEHFMSQLPALQRRTLELRLLDWPLDQIAADTGRSERTIRRNLDELERKLHQRWLHAGGAAK